LSFLAPAVLLVAAARLEARTSAASRPTLWVAPLGALIALVFGLLWAVSEIRRLFHGPVLSIGGLGYSEAVAYALVLIGAAWAATAMAAHIKRGAKSAVLDVAAGGGRWIALAVSVWWLGIVSPPWWGFLAGRFDTPILFFALFGACVVTTTLFLHKATKPAPIFAHAVKIGVILEVFAMLTLLIRFAFHGEAMRTPLREASVETWTFSAAWAVYGLVVLVAGARSGDRALRWLGLGVLVATTLKVFLFDMATLEGVIRAASFLALGVLLLVGALAARRLGARAREAP
jgi:uncharacterized membrane protein